MEMHKAASSHMAKRPQKFLMSKNSKKNGNSFVGMMSKNFEKVPKAIPTSKIHMVFIICLLRGIGFSALLIPFKNFFILYHHKSDFSKFFIKLRFVPSISSSNSDFSVCQTRSYLFVLQFNFNQVICNLVCQILCECHMEIQYMLRLFLV